MAVAGAGYLLATDILCDCSYQLFEPIVDTTITSIALAGGYGEGGYGEGGYGAGTGYLIGVNSVAAMYVGALVIVGYGASDAEVAIILEIGPGNQFITALTNTHSIGEKVFGPTFPVRQPTDPLFTQAEMMAYLSTACNDFLTDCPLVYAINEDIGINPTAQNGSLPSDCMVPMRIALKYPTGPYPLRETSQSNLDSYDYRWQTNFASLPIAYFRDKVPVQMFGIWPRANNQTYFEIVYKQRQVETMGLLDGFLFPDVFLPIIKYRVLSFAYSKDGESRSPGLAKFFASKYDFGLRAAKMVLDASMDSNLEMSQ